MKRSVGAILLVLTLGACATPPRGAVAPASTPPARPPRPVAPAQGPVPPAPPETLFRFVVHGDTRSGHAVHRSIVEAMEASRPALVLQTGDLVNNSSAREQWSIFDTITGSLRSAVPFYPARGSHDGGGPYFEQRLPVEGIRREDFHYSFDRGRIHFVAIDTEEPIVGTDPQYRWLEADMEKARAEGKLIIPFFHVAIFSIGPHALQPDAVALRPVLHDLFLRNDVKLVFQGHDHQYYRTVRDGIVYVVTGGGGAPLYGASHPELGVPGDVFESVHHFCIGDVFHDRILVTAFRLDLSQVDTFAVAIPPS